MCPIPNTSNIMKIGTTFITPFRTAFCTSHMIAAVYFLNPNTTGATSRVVFETCLSGSLHVSIVRDIFGAGHVRMDRSATVET